MFFCCFFNYISIYNLDYLSQMHMWFKNSRYMSLKKKKMNHLKESAAPIISANTRRLKVESSKSTPQIKEPDDAGNSYLTDME